MMIDKIKDAADRAAELKGRAHELDEGERLAVELEAKVAAATQLDHTLCSRGRTE